MLQVPQLLTLESRLQDSFSSQARQLHHTQQCSSAAEERIGALQTEIRLLSDEAVYAEEELQHEAAMVSTLRVQLEEMNKMQRCSDDYDKNAAQQRERGRDDYVAEMLRLNEEMHRSRSSFMMMQAEVGGAGNELIDQLIDVLTRKETLFNNLYELDEEALVRLGMQEGGFEDVIVLDAELEQLLLSQTA